MNKLEELKEISAQKKALADKQKTLRAELDETKEERKEARKVQAQCRKDIIPQKAVLRDLSAAVYGTFSEADVDAVNKLADDIMNAATELAGTIRSFAEAAKEPEVEAEDEEI